MLFRILVVFSLYCTPFTVLSASTHLKKVLCSYEDEQCLTDSMKAIFRSIVAGRPGEVEPSDPLFLDEIVIEEPNVKLVFSKAKMTGLLDCSVRDVLITPKNGHYRYEIWCPSITYGATFEGNGVFDGTPFDGRGTSEITFKNYDLLLTGYYVKYFDEAGDLHTHVTNFDVELDPEEVIRNVTGLCFEGVKSTDDAVKDKSKQLELHVRQPIMYKFLEKHIKNFNSFLKAVPIKDIHYRMVAE